MTIKSTDLFVSQVNVSNSLIRKHGFIVNDTHVPEEKKGAFNGLEGETDEQVERPTSYHEDIRYHMSLTFSGRFKNFGASGFPVAKITYVAGLLIAIDPYLRVKFFDNYDGPVPGIVQFLLNSLRIGILKDGSILTTYERTQECLNSITECKLSYSFLNMTTDYNVGNNLPDLIAWFVALKKLDYKQGNKERYFDHYVPLKRVPIYSNEILSLPGLCIKGSKAFWYRSCQSVDVSFKKQCQMISLSLKNSLHSHLLDEDVFESMLTEEYFVENVSLDVLKRDLLPFILTCPGN